MRLLADFIFIVFAIIFLIGWLIDSISLLYDAIQLAVRACKSKECLKAIALNRHSSAGLLRSSANSLAQPLALRSRA